MELGNAHSRRFAKKHVQCKQLDAGQLTEKMVNQRYFFDVDFRKVGQVPAAPGQDAKPDEKPAEGDAKPQKPGGSGGGPWRAFVHDQESNDLRRVGEDYRGLKAKGPDDPIMAECVRKCRLGT
eukprot:7525965-Pyramimonas_sp.AAC.1